MRRYEAAVKKCAEEVLDMLHAHALASARAVSREHFAQVLMSTLPAGPRPNTVELDMDLLTTGELRLLALHGDLPVPDIEQMTPPQIRAYLQEQP